MQHKTGIDKAILIETYLGASSGLDGNEANVARMVVSLNRSRCDCQALPSPSILQAKLQIHALISWNSQGFKEDMKETRTDLKERKERKEQPSGKP